MAAPRRAAPPTAVQLRQATSAAIAEGPTGRTAEALAAFLFAWRHHWPQTFATAFGADADAVIDWAAGHTTDQNRYLKLRRIAIENLARVL